ncbi:class I SAM-dependent methyltransferase [Streptomyces coffeae]|uniref:Class I SAM-dependent methyltransferase n=1 Tax=Streptomyces coffeae TaxID=621382 RepID=A0ABS1NC81_9ACTN|nr:class I SAM-dependent methyltransferase [Streptomyces coffeae]
MDLGCGEGGGAVRLARRGRHVTAVDISQVALDRAAVHTAPRLMSTCAGTPSPSEVPPAGGRPAAPARCTAP